MRSSIDDDLQFDICGNVVMALQHIAGVAGADDAVRSYCNVASLPSACSDVYSCDLERDAAGIILAQQA